MWCSVGPSAVNDSRKLLETLLGKLVESDPDAIARSNAAKAVELFGAARAAGVDCSALGSEAAIVEALCAGLGGKVPAGGQFPFLTGVERQRIADALELEEGELRLAPEPEIPEPIVTDETEKQIQRHARLIATLSSSAAAVDSPQLKKLATVEEIVAAICTTGLGSGPWLRGGDVQGARTIERRGREGRRAPGR